MKNKILIIEDELDLSITISMRLRYSGYETKVANDGVEALELLKNEKFDLIVLDVMMPTLDGLSFAAILRSREDTKKMKIIVMTSRSDKDTREICGDLEVSAYIIKPYEPDILLSEIKKALK